MRRIFFPAAVLLIVISISLIITNCSADAEGADARKTVISLFGAMEKNDKAALTVLLDLEKLMKEHNEDYALNSENPRMFANPQEILDDLTGNGKTKTRWFSLQRIINKATVNGDVANVEVTFVDKQNSRGYLTKFGLHKINGKWKIFSFHNVPDYKE